MRRAIYKNNKGVSSAVEIPIVMGVFITVLIIVISSISSPLDKVAAYKRVDLQATATQIESLLTQTSGESSTGGKNWYTEVATVNKVGLLIDPEEIPSEIPGNDSYANSINLVPPPPGNHNPNKPSTPVGETYATEGNSYSYITTAVDPDGDNVSYQFNWGDGLYSGWTTRYPSGEWHGTVHTWTYNPPSPCMYDVRVHARDEHGNLSEWSDPLSVNVTFVYIPHGDDDIVIPDDTCCFPAGTLISMADGTYKPIENIKVGDRVLSYDTNNKTFDGDLVEGTILKTRDGVYEINNGLISPTEDHPILVKKPDGRIVWAAVNYEKSRENYLFRNAEPLNIGDEFLTYDGFVLIKSIVYKQGKIQTYTFGTSKYHTYLANGIVVSNSLGQSQSTTGSSGSSGNCGCGCGTFVCPYDGVTYPCTCVSGQCVCQSSLCGSPPTCCFPAGTMISMADGSLKPIEQISKGDMVLSYDLTSSSFVSGAVSSVIVKYREGVYDINNGLISPTNDHPIYIRKSDGSIGWGAVDPIASKRSYQKLDPILSLEMGDEIFTADQKWVKVESIVYRPGAIITYTFDVEGHDYYFANGVLAHNAAQSSCSNGININSTTGCKADSDCLTSCYDELPDGIRCSTGCPYNYCVQQGYTPGTLPFDACVLLHEGQCGCAPKCTAGTCSCTVNCACHCFLAGTKIIMADDSLKNIEDVKVGDNIKSYNEQTGTMTVDEVYSVCSETPGEMPADYYLIINGNLKVTPNHELYVNGKWTEAGNLTVGDYLSDGSSIFSIEKIYERVTTYNLRTETHHNYIVAFGENNNDYVIAHNDNNYPLGGYDEQTPKDYTSKETTANDYSRILNLYKINAMKEISYQKMKKEIFNLPDNVDFSVIIKSYDGVETLLDYHPTGMSPYTANVVALQQSNIVVYDPVYKTAVYGTIEVAAFQ